MIEYLTKLLQKACEKAYNFLNPGYSENMRLERFEELRKPGRLERMFSPEIYEMFRIRGVSSEI